MGSFYCPSTGAGRLLFVPSILLACISPHVHHTVGGISRARRLAISPPSLLPMEGLSGDTLCLREHLPVVGMLGEFFPFWEEITSDQWVDNVLRNGYSIKLLCITHFVEVRNTRPPLLGTDILSSEVDGLLHKHAVGPGKG